MPAAAVVGKEYIGSVAWSVTGGAAHSGLFQANTSYTAKATLYPLQGYSFEGVQANFFEHDEKDDKAASSPNPAYDADKGVVTIVFPPTNPLPKVDDLDLTLKVPAPVRGADPVTYFAAPQYTGKVAWSVTNGAAHSGAFKGETVYTATVTLTAAPGWSFEGLASNAFTHSDANTGTVSFADGEVVTIVFPATEADPVPVNVKPGSTWGQ